MSKLREAIAAQRASHCGCECWHRADALLEAAEAHLIASSPKTKMVEVWRVEYAYNSEDGWFADCKMGGLTQREAEILSSKFRRAPPGQYACIRVTGPHLQEVPQ